MLLEAIEIGNRDSILQHYYFVVSVTLIIIYFLKIRCSVTRVSLPRRSDKRRKYNLDFSIKVCNLLLLMAE